MPEKTQTPAPASRQTLTARPKSAPSNAELFPLDCQDLMERAAFRRFMLTVFDAAGMFTGSFHSEAGASHFAEGRRSLGLDMLRNLEQFSGHDALIRILQEQDPRKEASNGRRNHDHERQRELDGGDVDVDDERGREQFLDYGNDRG